MTEIETVSLESANLVEECIEQIKALFPEVAVEHAAGIDFEKLRLLLGDEVDDSDERYAFTWPGKRDAIKQSQRTTNATLRPCPKESSDWNTTENLYIEGDNLEVLKLLQRAYHGKVKLIYIDPPYNTGHDFVYKDDFGDSIENYKKQAGLAGQSNPDTSGRYHSDWCSMMYPRLKLARELLSDDGIIMISIKTQENDNLEKLCSELFGENNEVGCITWESVTQPANAGKAKFGFQQKSEFILVYSKGGRTEFCLDSLGSTKSYPHHGKFGPCRFEIIEKSDAGDYKRDTMKFKILGQEPRPGKRWQIGEATARELERTGKVEIVGGIVKRAVYPDDEIDSQSYKPFWSHYSSDEYGTAQNGKKELNELMEADIGFDTVKPVALIQDLTKKVEDDAIVLDFFSGSATTAHAVMRQCFEDGGHRRFIMVQLPEVCADDSDAHAAGYNTICEIGKERIRRAAAKLASKVQSKSGKLDFGEQRDSIDLGFRVLKLDESSFIKPTNGQLVIDRVRPGRSDLDIIFEMMLKWGLELTYPIEKTEINGYPCYSVAYDELICCMEPGLTTETIEAIAELEPRRVFMMDGVIDDTVKLNAMQIFKRVEAKTQQKIDLRTV